MPSHCKAKCISSSTFPFVHYLQILSSLFSTSTHLFSQFSSPPPPPQLVLSAHILQTFFLLTFYRSCLTLTLHQLLHHLQLSVLLIFSHLTLLCYMSFNYNLSTSAPPHHRQPSQFSHLNTVIYIHCVV